MNPSAKRIPFSAKAKTRALVRAGGKCERCQRLTDRFEFDHWTPVAYDGPSVEENCRALCVPCHRQVTRVFVKGHAKVKRLSARAREAVLVEALRDISLEEAPFGHPNQDLVEGWHLGYQHQAGKAERALKRAGLE